MSNPPNPATTRGQVKIMTIADTIKVVVHDSINQVTTYALEEQGDWFEDEIRAVRKFLKPGDTAVDIRANLGMYALSMASAVGDQAGPHFRL